MTKILNLQDLHINPEWIDESEKDIAFICSVAKKEKVNGICIAGDFFDKAVMATDKNKWNRILNIARQLQSVAQVYFIYGTPSHDVPGCYDSFIDIGWKQIGLGKSEVLNNDTLIIGIPEITPAFLNAKFPELSKDEINEKQYELVNSIIDSYYVPKVADHNKRPVHFMLHGHISGTKFRDDQKPRTTDFMYSEKMLEKIGADYYQLGHIHLPQRLKTLNGGYGGGLHLTYKDLNYKAGFDIVEYDQDMVEVKRTDLDKPMMKKITIENIDDLTRMHCNGKEYNNTNLWIDIKCDREFANNFDKELEFEKLKLQLKLADKSKLTLSIQHKENVRIDKDEYEKCLSLESLYKIYNKDVTKSVLEKLKIAETENNQTLNIENKNIELLDVYLKGSKVGLENGVEEIKLDFNDFETGANLIVGKNGQGKSFLLGFCTPFSVHLPTSSDLKSLFSLKNSELIRTFKINDDIITQKILINALSKNPIAKYYMSINDKPIDIVTGNKKFFDDAVTEHFGTIRMFLASTFRGQKTNKDFPNLEDAKESDLREIFTELSGIDRKPLKEFAHEKVKTLKNDIELDESKISGMESNLKDDIILQDDLLTKKDLLAKLNVKLKDQETLLSKLESSESEYQETLNHNTIVLDKIKTLENDISVLKQKIERNKTAFDDLDNKKQSLINLESDYGIYNDLISTQNILQSAYMKEYDKYTPLKTAYDEKLNEITTNGNSKKSTIESTEQHIKQKLNRILEFKENIKILNDPCDHCGKISISNEGKIQGIHNNIDTMKIKIEEMKKSVIKLKEEKENLLIQYSEHKKTLPNFPIKSQEQMDVMEKLSNIIIPELSKINLLKEQIKQLENVEAENKLFINDINSKTVLLNEQRLLVKDYIPSDHEVMIEKVRNEKLDINNTNNNLISTTKDIEYLEKSIDENDISNKKINTLKTSIMIIKNDILEWDEIEKAFSPKGIPALELSLIAPQINSIANDLLKTYNSRYQVDIITQDLDSKNNVAEKFKILVDDSKSDDRKNLPVLSGGQAVWVTRALQESISRVSCERSGLKYMYSIIDEVDGALDHLDIGKFYDMINQSLDGNKKLLSVSHNESAKESMQSVTDVTKFYIDYLGE